MPRAGSPRRTVRSVMTPRLCSTNTTPGAITTPPAKRNPATRVALLIQIARNPYRPLHVRARPEVVREASRPHRKGACFEGAPLGGMHEPAQGDARVPAIRRRGQRVLAEQ